MSVMLYPCMLCVALLMCLFVLCVACLTVFVNCLVNCYVISLSDFAYYVFGQEPAVAVHLALWYVLLVCHQYDVCENSVGSVYVGGYCGLSESGLCVFCKLCPVCFLVVGKGPSVLL